MLGEFIEVAPEFQIKHWVERKERTLDEDTPGTPIESSKQLMFGFRANQNHSSESLESLKSDELLACEEFVRLVQNNLSRELVQEELDSLGLFFKRLAPFRRKTVGKSLERSIAVKGADMHVRYYLEQLEQAMRRR
jgi:hypothetical protein